MKKLLFSDHLGQGQEACPHCCDLLGNAKLIPGKASSSYGYSPPLTYDYRLCPYCVGTGVVPAGSLSDAELILLRTVPFLRQEKSQQLQRLLTAFSSPQKAINEIEDCLRALAEPIWDVEFAILPIIYQYYRKAGYPQGVFAEKVIDVLRAEAKKIRRNDFIPESGAFEIISAPPDSQLDVSSVLLADIHDLVKTLGRYEESINGKIFITPILGGLVVTFVGKVGDNEGVCLGVFNEVEKSTVANLDVLFLTLKNFMTVIWDKKISGKDITFALEFINYALSKAGSLCPVTGERSNPFVKDGQDILEGVDFFDKRIH
ncbi:MAG: hypothetical protein WCT18_02145 [Patescibacteria group bacterium]